MGTSHLTIPMAATTENKELMSEPEPIPEEGTDMPRPARLQEVSLADLRPNPDQPRKTFDEAALAELADSIERNGLIQPIVAIEDGDGFTIVAGERRFRAV